MRPSSTLLTACDAKHNCQLRRYYGGNEFIDQMELLAQKRALAAYGLDPNEWACNVQTFSGVGRPSALS